MLILPDARPTMVHYSQAQKLLNDFTKKQSSKPSYTSERCAIRITEQRYPLGLDSVNDAITAHPRRLRSALLCAPKRKEARRLLMPSLSIAPG
jgi:hypothetical protein